MRKNLKSSHDGIICRVCVADTASKHPALTGETERDKLRTGGENWKFGRYPKLSHRLTVSRNRRPFTLSLSKGRSWFDKRTTNGSDAHLHTLYDSNHSGVKRTRIIRPPWSAS